MNTSTPTPIAIVKRVASRIRPANPLITEECRLRRPLTKAEVARVIADHPEYFSVVNPETGYTEEQFWSVFDDCEEQAEKEQVDSLAAVDDMARLDGERVTEAYGHGARRHYLDLPLSRNAEDF